MTADYWRGWCDYALGNYSVALEQFKQVGSKTEGDLKTRFFWAAAESAYEMKNYSAAADYYQKALSLTPAEDRR